MSEKFIPMGYLINQYQYARRYRYNSAGCISYFNKMLGEQKQTHHDYLAFGDFDLLEFIKVNTFREYYDVSTKAKQWLGKRQSVLLYDISSPIGNDSKDCIPEDLTEKEIETRIFFNEAIKSWVTPDNPKTKIDGQFFCLSMLSITNEISLHYTSTLSLLKLARIKIHEIIDALNSTFDNKIYCEVFGSLNAAELGIIFLSNEYVDILRILDSIKHIKVRDENGKDIPVFLNCYSTIGIRSDDADSIAEDTIIKGTAVVQIAIQDLTNSHSELTELAHKIANESSDDRISYSVGEYDLVVEVPAKRGIQLISSTGELAILEKDTNQNIIKDNNRKILRSNIRLLYTVNDITDLDEELSEKEKKDQLFIPYSKYFDSSRKPIFEESELINDSEENTIVYSSNETYYRNIRRDLKKHICSSAGAVDTLDMLYTDYKSVLTGAYSAIWVSDLHRQFKSVLHAIGLMLYNKDMSWDWSEFRDVTNAFKQQIYHLSQSSRHFFEIPSCHLRSTGQYDFLMHTYYGITKKIIEIIYRLQQSDKQSELVPFITVNTVPQVTTEMFFEVGKHNDMRTINLNIPNSIIFSLHRGIGYLTHELFHYTVPADRTERNYRLALLYLSIIFKNQVLKELQNLLTTGMDLSAETTIEQFFICQEDRYNGMPNILVHLLNISLNDSMDTPLLEGIEVIMLELITQHYYLYIQKYLKPYQNSIRSKFEAAVIEFAYSENSDKIFEIIFKKCFQLLYIQAQNQNIQNSADKNADKFLQRLEYCKQNTDKFNAYVAEIPNRRLLSKADTLNFIQGKKVVTILEPCRSALKEACADIAMVSLNKMRLEEYLFFCIQNWKDNFETDGNEMLLDIMKQEYEQKLRIAIVAEYFYQKNTPDWEILRGSNHKIHLSADTEKSFRHTYSWFYVSGKVIKPNREYTDYLHKENKLLQVERFKTERKLNNEADAWINFFLDCYHDFRIDYAMYYDICFSPILDNYNVDLRLNMLTVTNNLSKESKAIAEENIKMFNDIQAKYRAILEKLPSLSIYFGDDFDTTNASHTIVTGDSYKDFLDSLFACNISVADSFQRQYILAELAEINCSVQSFNQEQTDWEPTMPDKLIYTSLVSETDKKLSTGTEFTIHSLNELMFYLRHCSSALKNNAKSANIRFKDFLWFRGHSSTNYKLLPSIIRRYDSKKQECFPTLRKYQLNEYEEFKFRADGAAEMPTGVRFTQSDYIALMQHYFVPTNFLDWTENVSTSLYFALEHYFDYPDIKERSARGFDRDAVLYIFSPSLYNNVRNSAIKEAIEEVDAKYKDVFPKELTHSNIIPNLSTKYNEYLYSMYILGTEKFDDFLRNEFGTVEKCVDKFKDNINLKKLCLPLAVWTSRLNSRIRTQSGCFVAFNLYCPPIDETPKNTPFNYCELEQIQKSIFKESDPRYLYKLVIDKSCCEEIVNWLKAMGVSRENIYPELERLKDRFD